MTYTSFPFWYVFKFSKFTDKKSLVIIVVNGSALIASSVFDRVGTQEA